MPISVEPKLEIDSKVWDGYVAVQASATEARVVAMPGRSIMVVNLLRLLVFGAGAAMLVGLFGRRMDAALIAAGAGGALAALALSGFYNRVRTLRVSAEGWRVAARGLGITWSQRSGSLADIERIGVVPMMEGAELSLVTRAGPVKVVAATSRAAVEHAAERVEATLAALR